MNNSISKVLYDRINIEDVTTVFKWAHTVCLCEYLVLFEFWLLLVFTIYDVDLCSLQGNPFCASPDSSNKTRCFCKQVCFNLGITSPSSSPLTRITEKLEYFKKYNLNNIINKMFSMIYKEVFLWSQRSFAVIPYFIKSPLCHHYDHWETFPWIMEYILS